VKEALAAIESSYPRYQRTLLVLQKYMQMEKEEVPDPLPQVKKPIAAGQQYEATGKLVRRLQNLGDLPPSLSVPQNSLDYSGAVAEGVKHFQLRHGLDSSGKLGAQTITELNRPMSDRVEQLRLMLERFRWMPHSFAQPRIVVKIPEFVLRAFDSSLHPALIMPVVVGRALRTRTPVLEEEMKYLIFWPYWNAWLGPGTSGHPGFRFPHLKSYRISRFLAPETTLYCLQRSFFLACLANRYLLPKNYI
jgi:murein L,D-transpeptidase YcbB/YkuD